MKVAVGTDHAGFPLKGAVVAVLQELGHVVVDLGTHNTDPIDYPDVAEAVATAVIGGKSERAIVVCGSGIGASVTATRVSNTMT